MAIRRKRRKRRKLKVFRFFIMLTCFLVLCGGIVGCAIVYVSIQGMPQLDAASLKTVAHTIIYDQDGKHITQIGVRNSEPIAIRDVPNDLIDAVLAIEDPSFYKHPGFSVRGILRAAFRDVQSGELQEGGSTITQQLVKISFLTDERTMKRKIQELVLSLQVERHYTKDEILEMYLNNIYMGEGAYGIQAASQTFLGIDLTDDSHSITLEQAALLAGLPQAPSAYSPFANPELAKNRRNLVLDSMARIGLISEGVAAMAKETELELDDSYFAENQYPYPYFVDYLTDILVEEYGETEVFKGGLRVYTTLDQNIQQIAETAMKNNNNFPASNTDENGNYQPQGAVVVIDPASGEIKALVGGREHTQKRQWNRAVQSTRQPGSAFKPLIAYAPAIDLKDLAPASVIDDAPVNYGSYSPRNNDGRFRGLITLRDALTSSVNIVAVKLLMDVISIDEAVKFASGLGIQLDPNYHGASMALGGLHKGVSPLQMAAAYAAFPSLGEYHEPTVLRRVERFDGTVLDEPNQRSTQAMKATTAYLVTNMLENVIQRGTGTRAQIGRPAAGKTGTTDEGKDVWFVGYTPDLVCSVWIGYDTPTPMPYEYGGIYPAQIWREIMSNALKNVPSKEFTKPPGIVSATVDRRTGLLEGPNTPPGDLITDLFREGTVPTNKSGKHVSIEVCAESGLLPNPYCPVLVSKTLLDLPNAMSTPVEDQSSRVPQEVCTVHAGTVRPQNPAIPGMNRPDQDSDSSSGANSNKPPQEGNESGTGSSTAKPPQNGASSGLRPPQGDNNPDPDPNNQGSTGGSDSDPDNEDNDRDSANGRETT